MSVINRRQRRNNRKKQRCSAQKQKKRNEFRKFFSQKKIRQCATCRALKQNVPKSFLKCEHKSQQNYSVTEITSRPSNKKWKNVIMNRFFKPEKNIFNEEYEREKFVIDNLKETEQFDEQMRIVKIWLKTDVYPRKLLKYGRRIIDKKMESMALAQKEVKEMEQIFQKLRVRDGKPLSIKITPPIHEE